MNRRGASALRRLAAVLIPLLLLVFHALWLPLLGTFLISTSPPVHADAAIVLAGDGSGNRILHAASLVKQGYVPKVFVSGPLAYYGMSEDQLAVSFAVRKGFPQSWFEGLPIDAYSTLEEAEKLVPELRRRGVQSLLLVTSDYHTGRAGRIWRKAAAGIGVHTVAAPDPHFRAATWWRNREARKRVFSEWVKTVTSPFGI